MTRDINELKQRRRRRQRQRGREKRNRFRACLHGGGGPQVGEVNRLGRVTHLFI